MCSLSMVVTGVVVNDTDVDVTVLNGVEVIVLFIDVIIGAEDAEDATTTPLLDTEEEEDELLGIITPCGEYGVDALLSFP